MTLKLVGIGAFGKMLSPSAIHLQNSDVAHYIRVLDRQKNNDYYTASRKNWLSQGAELVEGYEKLVGDGNFDGVVVCAGKNGDDYAIFKQLIPLLSKKQCHYFLLHMSTVSIDFVKASHLYCQKNKINYVNYPLTGGVVGANTAKMLILASGDQQLFKKLEPLLNKMGQPNFLGEKLEKGAETKLIGHLMVFNNLMGISSAVTLQAKTSGKETVSQEQLEFFDYLNKGAGGSRQWDVTLRSYIESNNATNGFLLKHAVVDILYAIKLMINNNMPLFSVFSLLQLALGFSYLLNVRKEDLATQSIIQTMWQSESQQVNQFISERIIYPNVEESLKNCVDSLPESIRNSVMLDINYDK